MENETLIECVYRRYRVQFSDGLIQEVESTKPLSKEENDRLLEEDNEIISFFKEHRVISTRHLVMTPKKTEVKTKVLPKGKANIFQRLNYLTKMKGEFTAEDYRRYLETLENKIKISLWTSYTDIKKTLELHKLEMVTEKRGHKPATYKVIDAEEINGSLYKRLLEDRKIQMGTIQ